MSFLQGSPALLALSTAKPPGPPAGPAPSVPPVVSPALANWRELNASLAATETDEPPPPTHDFIYALPELEAGTLLVANPNHECDGGKHLHHAVILVLGYDPEYGAIAVSLNWDLQTAAPVLPLELNAIPLRVGGEYCPSDDIVCLYRTPEGQSDFPGTFMKGLSFIFGFGNILHAVSCGQVDKENSLMYYGRQDWGRGELEAEVDKAYWCIAAVSIDYVFDLEPLDIYHRLVQELAIG